MTYKMYVKKEVEAKYLNINVAVRYEDEDMAYDAPLRKGDVWEAMVNLETETIEHWPEGETLSFKDMKICDQGVYTLYDDNMTELAKIEGYVPNRLLPGNYGDYLDLTIDKTGKITNWKTNANLDNFEIED